MAIVSPPVGRRFLGPLAAVLICVGCLAPFVNKAFFIDDPLFLWAAQHIQQHPLDPYGFDVNWYLFPERMADVTKNPPLACYALAVAAWLFGWSEIALHTAFLLPAAGAAWGVYRLAEGLCTRPLLATLAAVLTPVFLVSSTNVMCDTMMLCFWVWAIVCWRRGLERPGWLLVAGVLISLCALTKYFGISLIPLLLVYTLLARRRIRAGLVALLIPLAILTAYQLLTQRLYNRGLLLDAAGFSLGAHDEHAEGWRTPLIGLAFTGGCLTSVLFYLPLLWPRRRLLALLALAGALLAVVLGGPLVAKSSGDAARSVQAGFFLLGGVAVVTLAAADWGARRDADATLLFLWTAGTLTFALGVNWVVNGRSLLPLAPVLGISIARRLGGKWPTRSASRSALAERVLHSRSALAERVLHSRSALAERVLHTRNTLAERVLHLGPLVPAAVVALLATAADYQQADADRAGARRIVGFCAPQPGTLWFEGHWGFQYYLQQGGGKEVNQGGDALRFHKGDFLALPSENYGVYYEPDAETAREALVIEPRPSSLASTMSRERGAGFYSHVHGVLPFVFGPAAPVRYRLLRFVVSVDAADGETTQETER